MLVASHPLYFSNVGVVGVDRLCRCCVVFYTSVVSMLVEIATFSFLTSVSDVFLSM